MRKIRKSPPRGEEGRSYEVFYLNPRVVLRISALAKKKRCSRAAWMRDYLTMAVIDQTRLNARVSQMQLSDVVAGRLVPVGCWVDHGVLDKLAKMSTVFDLSRIQLTRRIFSTVILDEVA